MGYVKQTWVNNQTPVDADHLNHIEEGLETLSNEMANKQPVGQYVKTVNGVAPDSVGNVYIATDGSGVMIDTTLTAAGAAADAAAVGAMLNAHGVTPEMFGAAGDGVTDDTAAIRRCFAVGGNIVMKGTYLISYDGVIDSPNVRTISGDAKIILASGATADNSTLFKLTNATLVEGLEFDLNAQNMAYVILTSNTETDFTIRNCRMYNLRDTITTSSSCLVHIGRKANVVVDNLYFEDILKNGNGIVTDGAGAHNCIYCVDYKSGSFTNLNFREIHSSKSGSDFYIEDGSGLYVRNVDNTASTYIGNITGHNCCKRTVKTQCAGMVVVNGGHIFYDTDDLIAGIGINNTETESGELGKAIIMGVTGINRRTSLSTSDGFAGIISVSDDAVITDCYFDCPTTYAILPGWKTKIRNCKFIGNGVFLSVRDWINVDMSIEDCEHVRPQGFGWLVFSLPNAQGAIKVKDCIVRVTNDSTIANNNVYVYYPIEVSTGCSLTADNISFFNEIDGKSTHAIHTTDDDTVIRNVYIQRPNKDSVYIHGTGSLTINGMTMSEFELLDTRAVNVQNEGETVLLDMKVEGEIPSGKYYVIPAKCTIVDTDLPIEYPYVLFGSDVTITNNTPVERKDLGVPGTLKNIKDGSVVYTLYNGQKYVYNKATNTWDMHGTKWVALASPDGTVYKLTVANDGAISATKA